MHSEQAKQDYERYFDDCEKANKLPLDFKAYLALNKIKPIKNDLDAI